MPSFATEKPPDQSNRKMTGAAMSQRGFREGMAAKIRGGAGRPAMAHSAGEECRGGLQRTVTTMTVSGRAMGLFLRGEKAHYSNSGEE